MFFSAGLRGDDLPSKTVCLTFDDGPGETKEAGTGPRTLEVAQFLHSRKIEATFFVVGEFATARKEVISRVAQMNHIIGNHTFNHIRLADRSGQFAADQIARTDEIISHCAPQAVKYFRPPHGKWSPAVAGELNWTGAATHIGPILWDIDAADWRFWSNGQSARECAAAYIDRIRAVGRGVIIMHDSSFESEIRIQNNSFDAVKLIVDWLQENGYCFVRLDALPQVRESGRISSVIALQTSTGHYISTPEDSGGPVSADSSESGPSAALGMVELGDSRVALRCLSGRYLSADDGGRGSVTASARQIQEREVFTVIDLGEDKIAVRCANGRYLSPLNGGEVRTGATRISSCEILRVDRIWPGRDAKPPYNNGHTHA